MIEIKNIIPPFNLIKKDINLCIEQNTIFVITGNNGSGKTIMLELLAGARQVVSGCIKYNIDMSEIIFIPQNMRINYINHSIPDTLSYIALSSTYQAKYCFTDIMNEFSEDAKNIIKKNNDKNFNDCSIGEQKILFVNIAFALNNKGIVIADEPTASMSSESRKNFYKILNQTKKTCIFTTHINEDLDYLNSIKDKNIIIGSISNNQIEIKKINKIQL